MANRWPAAINLRQCNRSPNGGAPIAFAFLDAPMLTLRLFLILLVTLLCREICWESTATIEAMQALLSVSAACLGFGAIAKSVCIFNLRKFGAFADGWQYGWHGHSLDRWNSRRQSLETLWVLCLPATLMLTCWGPWIKQLDALGLMQSVSVVLWFIPSLAALVILELTTSQMEVYIQDRKSSALEQFQFVVTPKYKGVERRSHLIQVLDGSHANPRPPASLRKALSARIRLGEMSTVMACLLPVLLIALCSDALKMLRVAWPESLQSLAASGVGLGAVALFMPQWLSLWMGVEKLKAGELRDRIERYCKLIGKSASPMWVASDGRWAGAAVVGWLPGIRQLWLGDALVEQLTDEEVDMVVMHELAHLKRRHFLWRLIPVFVACALGLSTLAIFSETSRQTPAAEYMHWAGQAAGMLLASGTMLFGISYGSRRCELDADRQACVLGALACPWSGGDAGLAADSLSQALIKLHGNGEANQRSTWLHPALGQRLANLGAMDCGGRRAWLAAEPELQPCANSPSGQLEPHRL
jgi:Zn-dependent protease with chaperone function